MHPDKISDMYAEIVNARLTDVPIPEKVLDTKGYKNTRINIVARIKSRATTIINAIKKGKIRFADLPGRSTGLF